MRVKNLFVSLLTRSLSTLFVQLDFYFDKRSVFEIRQDDG